MFCEQCGAHNDSGSHFCTGCGAPIPPEAIDAPAYAPGATPFVGVAPQTPLSPSSETPPIHTPDQGSNSPHTAPCATPGDAPSPTHSATPKLPSYINRPQPFDVPGSNYAVAAPSRLSPCVALTRALLGVATFFLLAALVVLAVSPFINVGASMISYTWIDFYSTIAQSGHSIPLFLYISGGIATLGFVLTLAAAGLTLYGCIRPLRYKKAGALTFSILATLLVAGGTIAFLIVYDNSVVDLVPHIGIGSILAFALLVLAVFCIAFSKSLGKYAPTRPAPY